MLVWALGNSKGGVGKSLIAINLAVAASHNSLRVLLVDADPQGSCLAWVQLRGQREGPAVMEARLERLAEVLAYADGQRFDVVIIDTAGHDNLTTRAALRHLDVMLVPAQPNLLDLRASGAIRRAAQKVGVPAPVLLNRVHRADTPRSRFYVKRYAANGSVLPGWIQERVAMQDAFAEGLGVMEYRPTHPSAIQMEQLFRYVRRTYKARVNHA